MFNSLIHDSKKLLHKSALKIVQIPPSLSEILAEKKIPISIYLTLSSYFYAFQQVKAYVPEEIFTETYENIIDHVAEFIKKSKTLANSDLNERLKELGTAHQIFAEYVQNKRLSFSLAAALFEKFFGAMTNAWSLVMYLPVFIMLAFGLSTLFQGITSSMNDSYKISSNNSYIDIGMGFGPLAWGALSIGGAIAVAALLSLVWKQKLLLARMAFSFGATLLFISIIGGGMLFTDWIAHDIDSAKFETSNTYLLQKGQSKTLILGGTNVHNELVINIIEDEYSRQLGTNVVTVQLNTEIYQSVSWLETGIKPSVIYYQEDSLYKNRPATLLKAVSNNVLTAKNGMTSHIDNTSVNIFVPKGEYAISLSSTPSNEDKSETNYRPYFTFFAPKFELKRLTSDSSIAIYTQCEYDYDREREVCVDEGLTGVGNAVITITKL